MVSNQQIMSDIRLVMETGHKLELMNIFQGIPFICKATVTQIEGEVVSLETRDSTILCLKGQEETRVLGSDYFEPSLARVISVDIPTGVINLDNFVYSETKLGDRTLIRVQPTEDIQVQIEGASHRALGHLMDISLSGLGVQILEKDFHDSFIKGSDIQITLQLPEGKVNCNGMITKVDRFNQDYRLSIRFSPDIADRPTIFRYLIDRRKEIEEEVEKRYLDAM